MRRLGQLIILEHTIYTISLFSRDAEISESNAELAALQREAAELATELRVSKTEVACFSDNFSEKVSKKLGPV